jgi:hypothetical protein
MKFKLFGIDWDFSILIGALHAFIGMLLIGTSLWLDVMPVWGVILYFVCLVIYLATVESITKKVMGI